MAWSVEFMVLIRADGIQPCQYIDSAYAYAHGLPYIYKAFIAFLDRWNNQSSIITFSIDIERPSSCVR